MKISTFVELQNIEPYENGELIVNLQKIYPNLLCDYSRENSGVNQILVRKTIAEKLNKVQDKLTKYHASMNLVIVEGYRHPIYQERYFLQQLLKEHSLEPDLNIDLLIERANQCVALPSIAGHPTGGAIDLTIAYKGKKVDMGCAIADFTHRGKLPTFSTEVNVEAANNRRLLHDLMVDEGFAPYYGEWWHFSYGDREWAAFYGHSRSLYASLILGA